MTNEYRRVTTADTNAVIVFVGQSFLLQAIVAATTAVQLKIYDIGVAPTVGTSTPELVFHCPIGTTAVNFSQPAMPQGYELHTGIGIGIVKGATVADSITTACAAADACVSLVYR